MRRVRCQSLCVSFGEMTIPLAELPRANVRIPPSALFETRASEDFAMFCPHCGKQFTPDANFCPNCGAASTHQPFNAGMPPTRIVRPRHPRLIAGVCSGFALHYGWDVMLTRVVFAVLTLLTAFWLGVILYITGWVILPDAQFNLPHSIQPNGPNAT